MRIFLLVFFTAFVYSVQAQQLYMPRNIQKAYENGTRSMDGKPGKNYWQNHGKYDINVVFEGTDNTVKGSESIAYTNNSPDTLRSVTIRFVNNMHKAQAPRNSYVAKDYLSDGLTVQRFTMNGKKYDIDSKEWGTAADVKLDDAILPGQTVNFEIEWSYPLSVKSGREGQVFENTFFMAYAYPRISVYDDYNGWDKLPHTGIEFYNDFNDYTLAVKVPKDYVVWATGDLMNADEVLQPKIAQRYMKSLLSDEIIQIANANEMKQGLVTKQNAWNTWKFESKNINDITFSVSKDYVWDASSLMPDRKSQRRVSMQAAYADGTEDFTHVVKWGKEAIDWYSNNWPGIAYPYSKMTAFQGFGNMEYPMMVNDQASKDHIGAQYLLNHEIAHTWFPFYMGTNETRYAFMDEGWAVMFEYLIGTAQYGKDIADERQGLRRVSSWAKDASTESDHPLITMSTQLSGSAYRANAYGKPSLAYLALKDMLGDVLFKKALHEYMDRWNGKHPIPWDFFFSFNDATKQNLNWFWNSWFFSNNYIDLAIREVNKKDNSTNIVIENVGGFAIPFDLTVRYKDGSEETIRQSPLAWKFNPKRASIKINNNKTVTAVVINESIYVDATPENNSYPRG